MSILLSQGMESNHHVCKLYCMTAITCFPRQLSGRCFSRPEQSVYTPLQGEALPLVFYIIGLRRKSEIVLFTLLLKLQLTHKVFHLPRTLADGQQALFEPSAHIPFTILSICFPLTDGVALFLHGFFEPWHHYGSKVIDELVISDTAVLELEL